MGYTKKIKAGLSKIDYAQFVGESGTLFYDEDNGTLRISDGSTPGGQPVNLIGDFNDIAIGNITVDGTTIKPNVANANLVLESSGAGSIRMTSPIDIYKSDSPNEKILSIKHDGQVKIIVATSDVVEGSVGIIGNTNGEYQSPVQTGVMLHITGQQDDVSRTYVDGVNNYALIAGRRYNGTPTSPTRVLADQIITRYGCNAYNGDSWGTGGTARIQMVASEDHTTASAGTRLEFWSTPNGSTTNIRQGYCDGNGLTAINITTTGLLNVTNRSIAGSTPVLTVSANADGLTKIPGLVGTIAEFTGKDGIRSFIVQDNYGVGTNMSPARTGGQYVFRSARGTNAAPQYIQDNDILGEIGAAGWGSTGFGGVYASSIKFVANENYTDTARGGKLVISMIPNGSNTQQDSLVITPTTVSIANNGQFEGRIKLGYGTADVAPIQFQAGTLTTTPVTGSLNYDGKSFYATPISNERGLIPTEQTFVLNSALNLTANVTTPQNVFGVGVTLSANTRYHYRMKLQLAKNGSGSNTPTINFGLSGTATLFAHGYWAFSSVASTQSSVSSGNTMSNYITSGFSTGVPITPQMPVSTSYATVEIHGFMDINAAGTVIPQIAFSSAPNTSCSVQPMSSMRIYPVGTPGNNTTVGTWA